MSHDLIKIHQGSMNILEKTGIRLDHPEVIEIVKRNGIKTAGEVAYFTENQVMHWVGKAPQCFTVYARNPQYNMTFGADHIEFAPGYGAPMMADFDGVKRSAFFKDYINLVKLVHQSSFFNVNGGILVQPADLHPNHSFPLMLYTAITLSDKCLMGGAGGFEESEIVMDMLGITFEGKEFLPEKPRILGLISTSSPLQLSKKSLETILVFAKYGQPVIISPAPMAGTTGPITLAGHLVLANAEALAGIVVTQMIRESTPVIYGVQGSNADMRTCCSCAGSPDSALIVAYCARLAKMYGLPCRSGGIKNDAKSIDVQSGYESMMLLMVSCQEKINFIIHSAGILDTFMAMSYEKFIVDLEIIGMLKHFLKDIQIDEDRLGFDVINEVGPCGEFLTTTHTLKFLHSEHWMPAISLRGTMLPYEKPQEKIKTNILKKKEAMLKSYQRPEIDVSTIRYLEKYLNLLGVNSELLSGTDVFTEKSTF
ncbi:MAG: trimethylamine methyltransferase family protein [Bacillota bacterium]